jgi:hypothetical protein
MYAKWDAKVVDFGKTGEEKLFPQVARRELVASKSEGFLYECFGIGRHH